MGMHRRSQRTAFGITERGVPQVELENLRAIRDILTIEQWNTLSEVALQVFQIGLVRVRLGPTIEVTEDGGSSPTPTPAS